jgi:transcriptional regulator with XRE-family HTH domain
LLHFSNNFAPLWVADFCEGGYFVKMMNAGQIVRALREKRGMGQETLAAKTGKPNLPQLSKGTIQNLETGKHVPNGATLARVLAALGVSSLEEAAIAAGLLRKSRPASDGPGGIPILAEVPAGRGDYEAVLEDGDSMSIISRAAVPMVTDPDAYALVVRGDSMGPKYPNGSLVVCAPNAEHVPGAVYAIRFGAELDNECTLKRVTPMEGGKLLIHADNPAHAPRVIPQEWVVNMDRAVAKIGEAD